MDSRLYRQEVSLFLASCLCADDQGEIYEPTAITLLRLVFVRPGNDDISSLAPEVKVSEELERECQQIRVRVLTRCAGLLETLPEHVGFHGCEDESDEGESANNSIAAAEFLRKFPALYTARYLLV